jgi:hypothetical protein
MKFENEYGPEAVIHSNEDLSNESFGSTTDFSHPSKLLAFLCLQMHHMRQ